jgi:hypothetical protein
MSESNFRCRCGEPLYQAEGMHHRVYHCLSCNEFFCIKGEDHYWLVDEIDLTTGQIIPMEQTEKGRKHVEAENKRLRKIYHTETLCIEESKKEKTE